MKKDHLVQVKQLEKQCSTLQGKGMYAIICTVYVPNLSMYNMSFIHVHVVHAMEHERNEDQHRLLEESRKSKNKQQHALQTSYDSKVQ